MLGAASIQTEVVQRNGSIEIPLVYGASYAIRENQGQSFAILDIQYDGVYICSNSGSWSRENETPKTNHVVKVTKSTTTDGTIRITNSGTDRYYYKRII